MNTKFPRIKHVSFSPGAARDDLIDTNWYETVKQWPEIVITEKLDGANTMLSAKGVFARSHTVPATHASFDYIKALHAELLPNLIEMNINIYGENLYAIHSIEYTRLPSFFFVFAMTDATSGNFLSWNEIETLTHCLDLNHVPVLDKRRPENQSDATARLLQLANRVSVFGTTREGLVLRNTQSFTRKDFQKNILKYVRANHVQTDEHWTRNWKKAKISAPS